MHDPYRPFSIRQRVLICDTCDETLAVIDAVTTGGHLQPELTFRLTYGKTEYAPSCHTIQREGPLMAAAKMNVDIPGCRWERSVSQW